MRKLKKQGHLVESNQKDGEGQSPEESMSSLDQEGGAKIMMGKPAGEMASPRLDIYLVD